MPHRITLPHTLVAVLATFALAASPAVARPTDQVNRNDSSTSSLAGTSSSPRQDLRGEQAKDPGPPKFHPGQPTWPVAPAPLPEPATPAPASDGGAGVEGIWLVLGLGIASVGVATASAAGIARRHRVRARRVAA